MLPAPDSLHKRQPVRHQMREDVGIRHDDDPNDRGQSDRVPDHEPEDEALVSDLVGGGSGDDNGLRDELP